MLTDETASELFVGFVSEAEPSLRRALSAAFGSEVGRETTAEALAYGWEHWDRVGALICQLSSIGAVRFVESACNRFGGWSVV